MIRENESDEPVADEPDFPSGEWVGFYQEAGSNRRQDLRLEFREGDAHALPLDDASVDAAFAHMVLHSLEEPGRAIAEMARIVRPGGQVVLVDFGIHEHKWMEQELGLLWLGFEEAQLREWIEAAGLEATRIRRYASEAKRDLPPSFVATAQRPGGSDG